MNFPKSAHQQRVEEFMFKAGQRVPTEPSQLTEQERLLRAKLIYEEAMETIYMGLGVTLEMTHTDGTRPKFYISKGIDQDLEQLIDGCCDLMVVTTGTLSACGIPDVRFQEEVDQNNLAKFGPGGYKDENGKWIKPPNHKPPKIKELLEELNSEQP